MKAENYIKLEFPSKSANEALARAAVAAFAPNSTRRWTSWATSKPRSVRR